MPYARFANEYARLAAGAQALFAEALHRGRLMLPLTRMFLDN